MMIIPATGPVKLDTSKLNSEVIEWTSLKSEDVISGRVVSSSSNSALIQMLGARLEVRTPMPLTPGSIVQFQVESNAGGQLTLRALLKFGQRAEDSTAAQTPPPEDQALIEQSLAGASNTRLDTIRDVIDSRLLNLQARQAASRPSNLSNSSNPSASSSASVSASAFASVTLGTGISAISDSSPSSS